MLMVMTTGEQGVRVAPAPVLQCSIGPAVLYEPCFNRCRAWVLHVWVAAVLQSSRILARPAGSSKHGGWVAPVLLLQSYIRIGLGAAYLSPGLGQQQVGCVGGCCAAPANNSAAVLYRGVSQETCGKQEGGLALRT
jgi:hypothetical protein